MFFFSKGKMDVELEKYQFAPEEMIKGKVIMTLKKPIDAEGVKIGIYAYQKESTMMNGRTTARDRKVYEFEQFLDRKHGYPANQPLTYSFQIAVPAHPELPGALGAARKAIGSLPVAAPPQSAMRELPDALVPVVKAIGLLVRPQPVRWYLEASLDIKMAFDLRKKVEIQVVSTPSGQVMMN